MGLDHGKSKMWVFMGKLNHIEILRIQLIRFWVAKIDAEIGLGLPMTIWQISQESCVASPQLLQIAAIACWIQIGVNPSASRRFTKGESWSQWHPVREFVSCGSGPWQSDCLVHHFGRIEICEIVSTQGVEWWSSWWPWSPANIQWLIDVIDVILFPSFRFLRADR